MPRFHLQENSDRPIEQTLRDSEDLKNPGEAGYTPAGSDPQVRKKRTNACTTSVQPPEPAYMGLMHHQDSQARAQATHSRV